MPTLHFEGNLFGPSRQIDAPGGEKLVDVCDRIFAPVPFSCRAATCGTCRIEIVAGADLLEPPTHEEALLLAVLEDPPNVRLACQARIARDVANSDGLIRIRLAGDEI